MATLRRSGVFNLGGLSGDGASSTRPTRKWGGMLGRSLTTDVDAAPVVDHSLRFDGSAATAQYLSFTPSTTSTSNKFTLSMWLKRDELSQLHYLMAATPNTSTEQAFRINANNSLFFYYWNGSTTPWDVATTEVIDDYEWHHVVLAFDLSQSGADKVKIWIDGGSPSAHASGATYPSSAVWWGNSAYQHDIGSWRNDTTTAFSGQLAEVHFVDGQALDASYFGETRNSQWVPKEVTGVTYGNNGFYLPFDRREEGVTLLLDGSGGGTPTITDNSSVGNTVTNVSSGVSNTNITGPYGSSMDVLSFDGTNDRLEFDVSTTMQLSGDFTIETWMRRADNSSRDCVVTYWGVSGDPRFRFEFERVTDNLTFYDGTSNLDFSYASTNADVNDTWFHLAVTRSGSTYEVFVDGTSLGTQTGATTTLTGNATYSNKAHIGSLAGSADFFGGQMADFRITRGIARDIAADWTAGVYNSAPTNDIQYGSLGRDASTDGKGVTLLLDGSSTTNDVANSQVFETDTNVTASSTGGPNSNGPVLDFGSSSSTGYILDNDPTSLPEGTEDFTVEFWLRTDYAINSVSRSLFVGLNGIAQRQVDIFLSSGNTVNYYHTSSTKIAGTTILTHQQWHHIAAVRKDGTTTLYIDGASQGSFADTGSYTAGTRLGLGGFYDGTSWATGGNSLQGQMADVRVTRGIARDIAAGFSNFTPISGGGWDVALTNDNTWSNKPQNNFEVNGNIKPDDQLLDSPNLRFATFDPSAVSQTGLTISEANLQVSNSATNWRGIRSDFSIPENSKAYYEWVNPTGGGSTMVGVTTTVPSSTSWYPGIDANSWGAFEYSPVTTTQHEQFHNGVAIDCQQSGYTIPGYAVAMVAVDRVNHKIHFGIDGLWWTSTSTRGAFNGFTPSTDFSNLPTTGALYPALGALYNSNISFAGVVNFGQDHTFAGVKSPLPSPHSDDDGNGEFRYQPPSGFKALTTKIVGSGTVLQSTGVISLAEHYQTKLPQ